MLTISILCHGIRVDSIIKTGASGHNIEYKVINYKSIIIYIVSLSMIITLIIDYIIYSDFH